MRTAILLVALLVAGTATAQEPPVHRHWDSGVHPPDHSLDPPPLHPMQAPPEPDPSVIMQQEQQRQQLIQMQAQINELENNQE